MTSATTEPLLCVVQPGLFTVVVGLPEAGRQRYGVPAGGAMDPVSMRMANLLVRNPAQAPALEITVLGPALEFLNDGVFALAGADLGATLDNGPVEPWHAFYAPAGSVLRFGPRRSGARAYLAAAGGLQFANAAGASPNRVAKGDILRGHVERDSRPLLHLPPADRPVFLNPAVLRVLPGPQWDRFTKEAHESLTGRDFEVSHESSRMGMRLTGPALAFADGAGADIISEPTPLGTIQVTASGLPIILLADRPTTGGYAKIATVISADIGLAGQLAPGDQVRFRLTDLDTAQQAAIDLETRLHLAEQMATWSQ